MTLFPKLMSTLLALVLAVSSAFAVAPDFIEKLADESRPHG